MRVTIHKVQSTKYVRKSQNSLGQRMIYPEEIELQR